MLNPSSLNDKEILEIMDVLDQNISERESFDRPHNIMVWFSEAANRNFNLNIPKDCYYVYHRTLRQMSKKAKDLVKDLWDRGLVLIEIIKRDGDGLKYVLPRNSVVRKNLEDVILIPLDSDNVTPALCYIGK